MGTPWLAESKQAKSVATKVLHSVRLPTPTFQALTTGNETSFTESLSLSDPHPLVHESFTTYLQQHFAQLTVRYHQEPVADRLDTLQSLAPGLALVFKLEQWGVRYVPEQADRYQIVFTLKTQLKSLENNQVYWQEACANQASADFTLSELQANNYAELELRFNEASLACVQHLQQNFPRAYQLAQWPSPSEAAPLAVPELEAPIQEAVVILGEIPTDTGQQVAELPADQKVVASDASPDLTVATAPVSEPPSTVLPIKSVVRPFYFENGYALGALIEGNDRTTIKDSVWIDGRLGYQWNRYLGAHLEASYFPSSLRNAAGTINVNYLKFGPGLKFVYPLGSKQRWVAFGDVMLGYGRMATSSVSATTGVAKRGLAVGMDAGLTHYVLPWLGFSPYISFNSVVGSRSSSWFTAGAMVNFRFKLW